MTYDDMIRIETTKTGEQIEVLHYASAGAVPPKRLKAADLREMGLGRGWTKLNEILKEMEEEH